VYSNWTTVNYRESYDIFACNGILFNHESPRRGLNFVTKKITTSIAKMLVGKQKTLYLGNLDAKRDWGFAPEYVETMYLMLQQDKPGDYVVGTGESHTVREFLETAFSYVGVTLRWEGVGIETKGIVSAIKENPCFDTNNIQIGQSLVEIDPYYFRPAEVDFLLSDISKAKRILGWEPRVKFDGLVKIMMDHDLKDVGIESAGHGVSIIKDFGFTWSDHSYDLVTT